jgi:hypothetical protein
MAPVSSFAVLALLCAFASVDAVDRPTVEAVRRELGLWPRLANGKPATSAASAKPGAAGAPAASLKAPAHAAFAEEPVTPAVARRWCK